MLGYLITGFFTVQIEKLEIPIRPLTGDASTVRARNVQEIDELEEQINVYERRITQLNNSYESMQKRYLRLTEQRHVLKETDVFFEQVIFIKMEL